MTDLLLFWLDDSLKKYCFLEDSFNQQFIETKTIIKLADQIFLKAFYKNYFMVLLLKEQNMFYL